MMEIRGDEFIKNVQVQQEQEDLRTRLNELDKMRQPPTSNPYEPYQNNVDLPEEELGDIFLNSAKNEPDVNNKKKYMLLGLSLVLLFIITLVTIKLISNNDKTDTQFQNETQLEQDKLLNDQNIQQEYQKILNEKLKKVNEGTTATSMPEDKLDINKTQANEEAIAIKQEVPKEDPLEISKQEKLKNVVEEVKENIAPVKKEVVAQPVVKSFEKVQTSKTPASSTNTAKGVFIQVGAFSKTPAKKYLSDITSKGFSYKLHDMNIQGKDITKVLIGPFKDRNEAQNSLNKVRTTLNAPGAYILKI
ncbi:MAG: SPOR domain-containing protein [Candidatus Marinarcus sp.]|uniref:SPOR domain-containing protein n=1 Tax=Candidatus Marinarcus sp. TaxID=3100987 RepID=UPI003B00FABC